MPDIINIRRLRGEPLAEKPFNITLEGFSICGDLLEDSKGAPRRRVGEKVATNRSDDSGAGGRLRRIGEAPSPPGGAISKKVLQF